jgi:hypothetical protein
VSEVGFSNLVSFHRHSFVCETISNPYSFHVEKIFRIVIARRTEHVFLTCKLLSLEQLLADMDMRLLEM